MAATVSSSPVCLQLANGFYLTNNLVTTLAIILVHTRHPALSD